MVLNSVSGIPILHFRIRHPLYVPIYVCIYLDIYTPCFLSTQTHRSLQHYSRPSGAPSRKTPPNSEAATWRCLNDTVKRGRCVTQKGSASEPHGSPSHSFKGGSSKSLCSPAAPEKSRWPLNWCCQSHPQFCPCPWTSGSCYQTRASKLAAEVASCPIACCHFTKCCCSKVRLLPCLWGEMYSSFLQQTHTQTAWGVSGWL